jgi:hypothetical protein
LKQPCNGDWRKNSAKSAPQNKIHPYTFDFKKLIITFVIYF